MVGATVELREHVALVLVARTQPELHLHLLYSKPPHHRHGAGAGVEASASELGVTASAIAQLESRRLESVQFGTLRRYFAALGLTMKVTVEPASRIGSTAGG